MNIFLCALANLLFIKPIIFIKNIFAFFKPNSFVQNVKNIYTHYEVIRDIMSSVLILVVAFVPFTGTFVMLLICVYNYYNTKKIFRFDRFSDKLFNIIFLMADFFTIVLVIVMYKCNLSINSTGVYGSEDFYAQNYVIYFTHKLFICLLLIILFAGYFWIKNKFTECYKECEEKYKEKKN